MKTKALYMVLSQKMRDGHILFVEGLEFKNAKTKDAAKAIKALSAIKGFERLSGTKSTATVTIPTKNDGVLRAVRNLSNVELAYVQDVNPVDLMSRKYVVMTNPEESFKVLAGRLAK
jgi:ribosomal protein L4